jgi:DNA-binding transcriptional ArsR family regulator
VSRVNEAFRALADPTRREVLRLLRRGEMSAGDLADHFGISKPSMSHHFAVLKQADLIAARRSGQQIYYALNTTVVEDLLAAVWDLFPSQARKPPPNGRRETKS